MILLSCNYFAFHFEGNFLPVHFLYFYPFPPGDRLSPYVSICCVLMAVKIVFTWLSTHSLTRSTVNFSLLWYYDHQHFVSMFKICSHANREKSLHCCWTLSNGYIHVLGNFHPKNFSLMACPDENKTQNILYELSLRPVWRVLIIWRQKLEYVKNRQAKYFYQQKHPDLQ